MSDILGGAPISPEEQDIQDQVDMRSRDLHEAQTMVEAETELARCLKNIGLPMSAEMWRNVGDEAPVNDRASVQWREAHVAVTEWLAATGQQ